MVRRRILPLDVVVVRLYQRMGCGTGPSAKGYAVTCDAATMTEHRDLLGRAQASCTRAGILPRVSVVPASRRWK